MAALFLLGACAQQSDPSYYDTGRASTQTDARHRAQGNGNVIAPSQLQLGFGDTKKANNNQQERPVAQMPVPDNMADTRTYLGTIPCSDQSQCSVQRMFLTIAPDGQWRARNASTSGTVNSLKKGCWVLTNTEPVRFNLLEQENNYATLEFTQSNVLKLVRINGQRPLLDSGLTRQADIDPIDELASAPAENCNMQ